VKLLTSEGAIIGVFGIPEIARNRIVSKTSLTALQERDKFPFRVEILVQNRFLKNLFVIPDLIRDLTKWGIEVRC
jgi:hypothetical protein